MIMFFSVVHIFSCETGAFICKRKAIEGGVLM